MDKKTKIYSCLDLILKSNKLDNDYINMLFVVLFNKFVENPKTIYVDYFYDKIDEDHLIDIGMIGPDWAGILETVGGFLHSAGYNLHLSHAFVFPYQDEMKSFLIYRLKLNESDYRKFVHGQDYIRSTIERAYIQSGPINYLISHEVEKLERFEEVYNLIHNRLEPDIANELTGNKGEMIKFFTNRTHAYLFERKPEDIFEQVYHNFLFVKELIENPEKKFLYHVKNVKSSREHLTGVSVAGYEDKINLNMILTSLRKSVPKFLIRYIKKYSVDKIMVFRVEICDSDGNWFDKDSIRRIENALETLRSQGYLLSLETFDSIGGFEQYARAIIPILRNECLKTGIPQFYISLENKQEYFVEFKIMTVFDRNKQSLTNFAINFARDLSEVAGFHIFKISPPSRYNDNELNIIDVRVETEYWNDGELFYSTIKNILHNYLEKFRDFDEGMRLMDSSKLKYIIEKLTQYPDDIIMNFYYHLNEFYRISSFKDELLEIIKKCLELYNKILKKEAHYEIIAEQLTVSISPKKIITTGSIFYIAYQYHNEKMREILSVLSEYGLNFSRVDFENITVLIAILKDKKSGPLDAISFQQLKKRLEKAFE